MVFLRAEWNHLLLANYAVDPAVLEPFVPGKTELDLFEGTAFVSLVAFMFNRTRVLGVPFPGHIDFEEVNLRFYVRPEHDREVRAVTFIKEIVPRRLIPLVANSLFNENYVALPMSHLHAPGAYRYHWQTDVRNEISVRLPDSGLALPRPGSLGKFITEHYWGYAQGHRCTLEYEVTHPQWECCGITDYEIEVDFRSTYGDTFAFLDEQKPVNVQYARGSAVTVSSPRRI